MKEVVLLLADRIVRVAELEYIESPTPLIETLQKKIVVKDINEGDLIMAIETNIKNRIDVAFSYNDFCGNLLHCPHLFDRCWGEKCESLIPSEFTKYRIDETIEQYEAIITKVGKKYNVNINELKTYLREKAETILKRVFPSKQ